MKLLRRIRRLVFWGVFIVLVIISAKICKVDLTVFTSGFAEVGRFLTNFYPPAYAEFNRMLYPVLETIMIALLATFLGAIFSFIFAVAASTNLSPNWLRQLSRFIITTERALPEIIMLLLLIAALGLGPFPGVIALAIGCLGMLGRLFSDAIEDIDIRTLESMQSIGANKFQLIKFVILPEVIPSLIANTLFRFEINIRSSVLLGAVGAGGIGYEISASFMLLEYEKASMAIILVLILIFLSERVSDYLRKKILAGSQLK